VDTGQYFRILAEEDLCHALFANLIHDAIDACDINGMVVIAMHSENNDGVIAITNTGIVPESLHATFFDRAAIAEKTRGTRPNAYSAKLMTTTQNDSIAMTCNDKETCITVRLPSSNH